MITKAMIENVEPDGYHFRVRIPVFHKISGVPGSTPYEELPIAPCCVPPGLVPNYSAGDVVWVAFSDNQYSEPVIMGSLYNESSDELTSSLNTNVVQANAEVMLPDFDNAYFGSHSLHDLLDLATSNIPQEE